MDQSPADFGRQTPVGNVQVDAFCAHCNYNLFSQIVSRDDRLGILVCRCPECGRFTAAGSMTTASQKLAQRLATGALVIYIVCQLGAFAIAAGVLLGTQCSYLDDCFRNQFERERGFTPIWPELLGAAIAASTLGGLFATFCWHWRRGWRYLGAAIPAPLAALVGHLAPAVVFRATQASFDSVGTPNAGSHRGPANPQHCRRPSAWQTNRAPRAADTHPGSPAPVSGLPLVCRRQGPAIPAIRGACPEGSSFSTWLAPTRSGALPVGRRDALRQIRVKS